jgi:uncharacterized protein YjbJ (UPF0337 family)
MEAAMNWDRIEGNWKQFKGKWKEQWGKLTDDQLDVIAGKRDVLIGKVQGAHGISKDEAERLAAEWEKRQPEDVAHQPMPETSVLRPDQPCVTHKGVHHGHRQGYRDHRRIAERF